MKKDSKDYKYQKFNQKQKTWSRKNRFKQRGKKFVDKEVELS